MANWLRSCLVCVVGLVLVAPSVSGSGVASVAPQDRGESSGGLTTPEAYAARSMARIALLDLRTRLQPTPDDYIVAGTLLDSARAFAPEDTEILRGRIRAAWAAGEFDLLEGLSTELVRLDPRDTVAQLRLISSRIGRMQTVEQRLAAYERLLGPGGRRIDASVRSRLALDAALLEREHGSFERFADRIAQAVELDASNKEAAQLAWQAFAPLLDDPGERFELLLALLMADPTDPNVHRLIAADLARVGAFEAANRFHTLALSLFMTADSPLADNLRMESVGLQWQVAGPEAVVAALNRELLILRQQAYEQILMFEEARMPTDSLTRPEDIMLAPQYNQMRLVAALMAGDDATLNSCLSDMQRSFQRALEAHQEAAQLSTREEIARSEIALWDNLARQLIAIAWSGRQDASLRDWAARAEQAFGADAGLVRSLEAWAELRLGDAGAAVEQFEAIADLTTLNRVGYGLALESVGRTDDAIDVFSALARDAPLSLSGVWSRDRVQAETGEDPLETPERAQLARLASSVPAWVDRMVETPRSFMGLAATLDEGTLGPIDAPTLRVRLTNLAPIPLAVGGDRPLNSRFMLSPSLRIGMEDEFERVSAEVFEIDRRLRLMPSETLEVDLWPDPGMVGWLSEVSALKTVRQRWRVLQGYRLSAAGVPEPGVLCIETDSGRLERRAFELAAADGVTLASALDSAGLGHLPEVAAAVRARVLAPRGGPHGLSDDAVRRLASVAASRYASLPVTGRAVLLAALPSARLRAGMEEFDRVALEETDLTLVPLVLVTRVTDAEHPALASLRESETDGLGTFARALSNRLRDPEPTFSRLTIEDLGPVRPSGAGVGAAGP